jgi:hypothetical protein
VPRRLLLALLWLTATATATAVGFGAIHIVGDVISHETPIGPDFGVPPVPEPEPSATPVRRTLPGPAAALVVECTGRVAVLEDVEPAPGWRLVGSERGPDEDIDVLLTRGQERVAVEVYCNEGVPRAFLT